MMFEPGSLSRLVARTRTLLHGIVPLAGQVAGRGIPGEAVAISIYMLAHCIYMYGMILNEILFAIIETTFVDDIFNII